MNHTLAYLHRRSFGLSLCLLLFTNFFLNELSSQDAVTAFKKISPSIVALANEEGSGTGIILNEDGFILTNAHVVASPLAYTCKIEFESGSGKAWKEYKSVEILGSHPTLDLAIVKIDPTEHTGKLVPAVLAQDKGETAQTVYAIGNPASVGRILRKTITSGLISGVDREFEGEKYYQVDAAINPGNSGGPLVDKFGNVLGIVTFKSSNEENVGFAIPMHNFSPKEFVGAGKKKNSSMAGKLSKRAELLFNEASGMLRRTGNKTIETKLLFAESVFCYQRAINFDPLNPNLLYNLGLAYKNLEINEAAEAYMLQSLRLDPWHNGAELVYRELGLVLIRTKRKKDGTIVHNEGLAKFPLKAGKCAEDLGITAMTEKDYAEAAYQFAVVIELKSPGTRINVCNKMFGEAIDKLSPDEKNRLRDRLKNLKMDLQEKKSLAKKIEDSGKAFVNPEFGDFLKKRGGRAKTSKVDFSRIKFLVQGKNQQKLPKERIWTDSTGKYKIVATFVRIAGNEVTLKKADGSLVMLMLDRLSQTDQNYVVKLKY